MGSTRRIAAAVTFFHLEKKKGSRHRPHLGLVDSRITLVNPGGPTMLPVSILTMLFKGPSTLVLALPDRGRLLTALIRFCEAWAGVGTVTSTMTYMKSNLPSVVVGLNVGLNAAIP